MPNKLCHDIKLFSAQPNTCKRDCKRYGYHHRISGTSSARCPAPVARRPSPVARTGHPARAQITRRPGTRRASPGTRRARTLPVAQAPLARHQVTRRARALPVSRHTPHMQVTGGGPVCWMARMENLISVWGKEIRHEGWEGRHMQVTQAPVARTRCPSRAQATRRARTRCPSPRHPAHITRLPGTLRTSPGTRRARTLPVAQAPRARHPAPVARARCPSASTLRTCKSGGARTFAGWLGRKTSFPYGGKEIRCWEGRHMQVTRAPVARPRHPARAQITRRPGTPRTGHPAPVVRTGHPARARTLPVAQAPLARHPAPVVRTGHPARAHVARRPGTRTCKSPGGGPVCWMARTENLISVWGKEIRHECWEGLGGKHFAHASHPGTRHPSPAHCALRSPVTRHPSSGHQSPVIRSPVTGHPSPVIRSPVTGHPSPGTRRTARAIHPGTRRAQSPGTRRPSACHPTHAAWSTCILGRSLYFWTPLHMQVARHPASHPCTAHASHPAPVGLSPDACTAWSTCILGRADASHPAPGTQRPSACHPTGARQVTPEKCLSPNLVGVY